NAVLGDYPPAQKAFAEAAAENPEIMQQIAAGAQSARPGVAGAVAGSTRRPELIKPSSEGFRRVVDDSVLEPGILAGVRAKFKDNKTISAALDRAEREVGDYLPAGDKSYVGRVLDTAQSEMNPALVNALASGSRLSQTGKFNRGQARQLLIDEAEQYLPGLRRSIDEYGAASGLLRKSKKAAKVFDSAAKRVGKKVKGKNSDTYMQDIAMDGNLQDDLRTVVGPEATDKLVEASKAYTVVMGRLKRAETTASKDVVDRLRTGADDIKKGFTDLAR
ncbi:unnamed protein product, partial [marine sediment metagenome]